MLFLMLFFARGWASECFSDYELGDTHTYAFSSQLDVSHDFSHQENAKTIAKQYAKDLLADVTLVAKTTDGLFHFRLDIHSASWAMDSATVEPFRRNGELPIEQSALNDAYASAHAEPFYFAQACSGQVMSVFHPADEPAEVVATKKMFVNQFSHRATGRHDGSAHSEEEHDNHGKRSVDYSYHHGDAALDERHVAKSSDVVREFRPPADMAQTGDQWNQWRARTADEQTTTLRGGIVHRIVRRSELDFPPSAASYRGHIGKRDATHIKGEDEQNDEHAKELSGNSFWLRARGRSSLEHRGMARKRDVQDMLLDVEEPIVAHLSKRHATAFVDAAPHQLDSSSMPGPGSALDTLTALFNNEQDMDAAIQLHLLLKHNKEDTLAEVEALLGPDAPIDADARARVLRVLAEVGSPAEQALLCTYIEPHSAFTPEARQRAIVSLRSLMKPTAATLDALRVLMRLSHTEEREADLKHMSRTDSVVDGERKQATLMFGILAENVNASNPAQAREMRMELLERFVFAQTPDEQHVLLSALDNAYPHEMPSDDVLRDRIELGKSLQARYAEDAKKIAVRQRILLTKPGVRVHIPYASYERKRTAVVPIRPADDTMFCDADTSEQFRNEFRDETGAACIPCDHAIDPACAECQQVVVPTGTRCAPTMCDNPDTLECNAREVDTMVNANGEQCGVDGVDNTGAACTPQQCSSCTDCRDPDGRPCGSLCTSAAGTACPEPPSWFSEQFTRFFGANLCEGVERFATCDQAFGRRYNDVRPLKPKYPWAKRVGGEPVTGKLEAVLDARTNDDKSARPCEDGEDPWQRGNECRTPESLDFKVFAGAWAGLEAYENGQTYDYNPNAARLEVASAYLEIKSTVSRFWETQAEDMDAAAESVCDSPVQFSLYYYFAGKIYYHETSKDLIKDSEGRSTCFLADQTCKPTKPPERAWHTSTKDLYTRYLPDLLGNFDLTGIPLKLELLVKSEARVHHAVVYQYNEYEGGLMLSGFVEPQADCIVTLEASIAWAARWGNTEEAVQAQEMRNLIKVGIKAHIEVFAVEFPSIGAMNFETSRPCASVTLMSRALGGRVDVILEVLGVDVLAFAGGLFGVKNTLYEWKGLEFEIPFVDTMCCTLCPGSCQTFNLEENGINGANSRCNFNIGKCECIPGWDGEECMIPCPENCDVNLGILCDIDQEFTVGNGKFAPRGRCACEAGSWGYDCSLACPGGRKNPCNMHTDTTMIWKEEEFVTCKSDGTCDCWDFPPNGPFFGKRCDITCGDPNIDPPADNPDWTRCGNLGESHAECKYDAVLESAECKCSRNYYGPKCDQICPLTDDDRKAPCSLRGDCEEIDGRAVCLCDLGFYGEVCEFIAFDGSGVALAFNGADAEAKVEYPLTPIQLQAEPGQGFTMMVWFQAHALPNSERGVTLMKWRWGELRLQKDGRVALCDASSCLASGGDAVVTVGMDEGSWYWAAGSMQTSSLGSGARKVWLYKKGGAVPTLANGAEDTTGHTAIGSDVVTLGPSPFAGLLDHAHIIHRVATDRDLHEFRVGTVSFSTPGILFQALCDAGRGDHVYAETPFMAGPKHASVGWARSHVPLEWATLNSEIAPPLKIAKAVTPALRSYRIDFGGKRISQGFVSFRALSPMVDGRKRLAACRISAFLVDPEVELKTYDADENPLTDDQLRAMDTRTRFPIFEDRTVSGSELSAMEDPIELPRAILEKLRTGAAELEWTMLPNQPECNDPARPLIIENSFLTLHVEQVDGMVQTIGLDAGFAAVTPDRPLGKSFTFEAWVYGETVRKRPVADSALVMLYPKGAAIDLQTTQPDFAVFLLGNTNRGAVARFGGSNAVVTGYEIHDIRSKWFHVALVVSNCAPTLFVDGRAVGRSQPATGCSQVANWGTGARHELRIGSKFEGRFNDVLVWNTARNIPSTMHMLKDYTSADMLIGLRFDDRSETSTQGAASLTLADSAATTSTGGVRLVKGVIRGHIYGAFHRWKNCPGIDEVLAPERVCGNSLIQERGTCYVEDEENEGVIELSFKCNCNEGFAGAACQKQCLGAIKKGGKTVLCSGHGKCLTVDAEDDVMCECDEGYAGDGCEYTCPGWIEPPPPGAKECSGKGSCVLNPTRTDAVCKCGASSNAYGLSCEYDQSSSPLKNCDECTGRNEICRDGICDCEHPMYRVGEHCQSASGGSTVAVTMMATLPWIAAVINE